MQINKLGDMGEGKLNEKPIRVVFCTVPGVYSDIVLRELIQFSGIQLVGIVNSTRILRKKAWKILDSLLLIRKTGLRYGAYLWVVTTLFNFLACFRLNNPVRSYISRNKVPVLKSRDINSAESVEFLRGCKADMLLSTHFNQLIGSELLAMPSNGCLNIHPGKLPDYRGVEPVLHALVNGEKQFDVTVHLQDEQFDTGPSLTSKTISLLPDDTLFSLNCRLFIAGYEIFQKTVIEKKLQPEQVDNNLTGRYDSWPTHSTMESLAKMNFKLLDIKKFCCKILSRSDIK